MMAQATARQEVAAPIFGVAVPPGWVSAEQIAELLDRNPSYVRQLAAAHQWTFQEQVVFGGRRKLFLQRDVEVYLVNSGRGYLLPRAKPVTVQATRPVVETEPEEDSKKPLTVNDLPDRAQRKLLKRLGIVEAYKDVASGTDITMRDFWEGWKVDHPDAPPYPTFARWMSMYRSGGVIALADGRQVKKHKRPTIDARLSNVFHELFLDQNQRTVAYCYWYVKEEAKRLDIHCPSESTFLRLARSIPKSVRTLYREGNKAWVDKTSPFIVRDYESIAANEIWESDHHQLDMACRTNDGRVIFPWVTVWIDVRSRMPLAYYLCENPNSDTIFTAFKRAVMKYSSVPAEIYLDNGKDYRALDIAGGRKFHVDIDENVTQSLMARLGVKVTFAECYNARAKVIERYFRQWKEHFCRMHPSYRGGNVIERKEELATVLKDPASLPLMSELDSEIGGWLENIFIREPKRGLSGFKNGQSMIECYFENRTVVRTATRENLARLVMRQGRLLTVGRNGIKLRDDWYENGEVLHHRQGDKVIVRYDPEDMGRVYLYEPDGRFICEAQNVQRLAYGANHEDIRKAKRDRAARLKMDRDFDAQFLRSERNYLAEATEARTGQPVPDVIPEDGVVYEVIDDFTMVANGEPEETQYAPPTRAMHEKAVRLLRASMDRAEAAGGHKWKPRLD